METLLLTLSPLVVALLTQFVKPGNLQLFASSKMKTIVIRFIAAVFSFGAVVSTAMLTGQEVELLALETFSNAFLVFIGATGAYFLSKKKK